jgi:hypothetical protein
MSEQNNAAPAAASESIDSSQTEVSNDSAIESSESLESSQDSSDVSVQSDNAEDFEQEVEQAIEDGASQEEVKQMIREFTLKVNGKEFKKKIDMNDDEALRKELQLAAAGRFAMQESAELKRLYTEELGNLKKQPISSLKALGFSEEELIDLFANEINSYVEKKKRPKEEIEAEQRQKDFERLKAEKEQLEKQIKEEQRGRQMQALEKEIETDIISALESDTDLPATAEVVNMVIDNMMWAMKNGWNDVTAADVIPTVKQELQNKISSIMSSMKTPAALKAMLGAETLNKLRDERIQQAKKVPSVKEIKASSAKSKEQDAPKPKIKLSDWMR